LKDRSFDERRFAASDGGRVGNEILSSKKQTSLRNRSFREEITYEKTQPLPSLVVRPCQMWIETWGSLVQSAEQRAVTRGDTAMPMLRRFDTKEKFHDKDWQST
jgi:hypothetical protein